MNSITAFAGANLPSVKDLAGSLRKIETDVGSGGSIILRMDKSGCWVFGSDQTEVEDDSVWAVNPFSFVHGYIAWGDGQPLGERMAPVSDPLPNPGPAPEGATKGWEMQVGMALACTTGEDEGLQVRYTATSVGGKKAVQALALAIATQVDTHPDKPVPLVTLGTDHYKHKTYGKIYTPEFKITGWSGMDGTAEAEAEAEPEVEEEQPTRRRRRATT